MIVDGKNLILGRTASITAKKLLNGENVVILNAEKMVITGNKKDIFGRYKQRQELRNIANPRRGPHYPRTPERIVKRAVRGMLPYKKHKGRTALKKLRVYEGIPKEFKDHETVQLNDAALDKKKTLKYRTIKELSTYLGK